MKNIFKNNLSRDEMRNISGGLMGLMMEGCVENTHGCFQSYGNPNTCCSGNCRLVSGHWGVCE